MGETVAEDKRVRKKMVFEVGEVGSIYLTICTFLHPILDLLKDRKKTQGLDSIVKKIKKTNKNVFVCWYTNSLQVKGFDVLFFSPPAKQSGEDYILQRCCAKVGNNKDHCWISRKLL